MKIYFAGSIRAGRDDTPIYTQLINMLAEHGTVLTEHIGLPDLEATGEPGLSNQQIYERDLAWLLEADAVVAEVTTPSLGVGWEIGKAQAEGKPILCLYRETPGKKLSAMLSGNSGLEVRSYQQPSELAEDLARFIHAVSV